MNKEELRYFPLGGRMMKDKKVNDNIYGYLQSISYLNKDGERFIYKSDVSPTKIERYFKNCEGMEISLSTIKRNLTLFKSKKVGLLVEGKTMDNYNKEVGVYFLPMIEDEPYKLIPLETLKYLVDTSNGNVIKTYVYLLNKYGWKKDYTFTKKELIEEIGYKTNGNSEPYEMMNNILLCLVNNGLLDYVEFYDTNNEGKPTPKHKITFVGTKVKGMRKAKTPQPQPQPQSEFVF